MPDEKRKRDELTTKELSQAKGGIPYEKPVLIGLEAVTHSCNTGIICKKGQGEDKCSMGITCYGGSIEVPE